MSKRTFSSYAGPGSPAYTVTSRILGAARKRLAAKRTAPAPRGFVRRSGLYGRFKGNDAELKFFDTALAFNIDATGEVPATGQLALIPQGDTESQRDGRKCVVKSIAIKAQLILDPGAAADCAGVTAIYLVLDKQTNGAAAAVTDVFTSATNLSQVMRNMSESSRFTVLKKWIMDWNPAAGATTAYNFHARHIDFYKKVNIPLHYNSTTGAIGEIRSNNLFLLAGCNSTLDDLVAVAGTCRLRFADKC